MVEWKNLVSNPIAEKEYGLFDSRVTWGVYLLSVAVMVVETARLGSLGVGTVLGAGVVMLLVYGTIVDLMDVTVAKLVTLVVFVLAFYTELASRPPAWVLSSSVAPTMITSRAAGKAVFFSLIAGAFVDWVGRKLYGRFAA